MASEVRQKITDCGLEHKTWRSGACIISGGVIASLFLFACQSNPEAELLSTQTSASSSGVAPTVENHWLEAEFPNALIAPMVKETDASSSEQAFIWVPNDGAIWVPEHGGTPGSATYALEIESSGTYSIWGLIQGPTDVDDSFHIRVDGGAWIAWHVPRNNAWTWAQVRRPGVSSPFQVTLTAGTHHLAIAQREDGTKLDKLLVTNDPTLVPTSFGESAENIPQPTPLADAPKPAPDLVPAPPVITSHPNGQWAPEGGRALFHVAAANTVPAPTIRWRRKKNADICSNPRYTCSGNFLRIEGVTPDDIGTYDAILENQHGKVLSQKAVLQVTPTSEFSTLPPASLLPRPIIASRPADATLMTKDRLTLSAHVEGPSEHGALRYQWLLFPLYGLCCQDLTDAVVVFDSMPEPKPPIEAEAKEIHFSARSAGFIEGRHSGSASFFKDGERVYLQSGGAGGGRGFNVATIDLKTGQPVKPVQNFDTWGDPAFGCESSRWNTPRQNMHKMLDFLGGLPNQTLVLIAVGDEAGLQQRCPWMNTAIETLQALGSERIKEYGYRDSWAMISTIGPQGGQRLAEDWGQGSPVSIEATVRIGSDPDGTNLATPNPVNVGTETPNPNGNKDPSTFTIENASLSDAGRYQLRVSNDIATVHMSITTVRVLEEGLPVITFPPSDERVALGETARFSASARTTFPRSHRRMVEEWRAYLWRNRGACGGSRAGAAA